MVFKAPLHRLFVSLLRDRRGNFGMLSMALMIPMLALAGGTLDITRAFEIRTQLAGAADAAVLGTLAADSRFFRTLAKAGLDEAMNEGMDETGDLFYASTNIKAFRPQIIPSFTITTDKRAIVELNYQMRLPTSFLRLLGIATLPISGRAIAEIPLKRFTDIYLLLDNSPSMGVGATRDDIRRLQAATPDACAFACHNLEDGENSYYHIAKRNGVKLRIDVVREAATKMVGAFARLEPLSANGRMGIYTMGGDVRRQLGLTELSGLTTDPAKLGRAVAGVNLMVTPFYWYNMAALTPMDDTFLALDKKIGPVGNGLSGGNREKVVVFVSDGVADAPKFMTPCAGPLWEKVRCQEPIDVTNCERLKERGVRIAVLYTTYLPLDAKDFWYMDWIRPFQPKISPAMEACASPGLFFEVGFDHGIDEALRALFIKAVMVPRVVG